VKDKPVAREPNFIPQPVADVWFLRNFGDKGIGPNAGIGKLQMAIVVSTEK